MRCTPSTVKIRSQISRRIIDGRLIEIYVNFFMRLFQVSQRLEVKAKASKIVWCEKCVSQVFLASSEKLDF